MNINNVTFERSFGVSSQLTPSTMPEIAFAGRSNVGKSSLLNKLFNRLVRENRRIHYSSNVPLERVVIEKLLEGPKEDGMLPSLSSNTKLLGVSIVEGICYVNLDKSFLTETMSVQQELPIYSIVNSLVDACNIHGVQISVEGDTKVTFRESMKLDQIYEADYSYLESDDEN